MAISGRRVTVTTQATQLDGTDRYNLTGQSIAVTNAGAAAVDLGGATVATGAGYPLAAGASVSLDIAADEQLWAVAAAGTVEVDVLEVGV